MPSPEGVHAEVRSPVVAGQIVDRKYRVEGVLGAGGMGIVVSATHIALDEPVALKFMTLADGKGDATSRARFLREAKAARKLASAHVARVFDVGQLPSGEPYIVMELLKGDDLAKHLRTHGRLSPADTVRFVLQVCDAIREAHALGIVHRDLKPQNLFLSQRAGGGTVVKVLDFGIAKSIEATADGDGSLTTSQNVVGSPIYMSPEQLRASKHVDSRTDIWSLGVIMFELLSGKVPFVGDSVLELGMRIMTVPAPSLTELRAEIPAGLADAVQRCLEKEPEARFPDVEALANAIRPFADISQRTLALADTVATPSFHPSPSEPPPPQADQLRTGGEFAKTRSAPSIQTRRTRWWTRGLVAAAIAIPTALVALHRAPSTSLTTTPVKAGASTFHVALRVDPATATLRFDGEPPASTPFVRDVPLDGRPHTAVVEAVGYEPLELTFRDAPPPSDVALKALPVPTPAPPASSPRPPAPSVTAALPPRHEPRGKVASLAPSAPPVAPVAKTTNDAPILR